MQDPETSPSIEIWRIRFNATKSFTVAGIASQIRRRLAKAVDKRELPAQAVFRTSEVLHGDGMLVYCLRQEAKGSIGFYREAMTIVRDQLKQLAVPYDEIDPIERPYHIYL